MPIGLTGIAALEAEMHDRIKALNDEITRLREQNNDLAMEIMSYVERIDDLRVEVEAAEANAAGWQRIAMEHLGPIEAAARKQEGSA